MGGIKDIALDRLIEYGGKLNGELLKTINEIGKRAKAYEDQNTVLRALNEAAQMKPPPQEHKYESMTEFQRAPAIPLEPSIADLVREITSLKELVLSREPSK